MTTNAKKPSAVYSIGLTAEEIISVCGFDASACCELGSESSLENRGEPIWKLAAGNERTGNNVKIAAIEDGGVDGIETEFVVELEIDSKIIFFSYPVDNHSGFSIAKKQAQKGFIAACSLIGVYVGFGLVVNPSIYGAS